ncbi:hypothetical protein KYK29_10430 [Shinella daejeonensis]|uniref:hypothetical protein n=1 Tax=Shinella daejeonensis TaxID=659017 RepID=UPI0020C76852|nr:hypothetical protein [Shinella daejeonensis]MCP8895350.1 hypothetical protein [Shinella daejeonensis]
MAGLTKVAGAKIYIGQRVPYKTSVRPADFAGQTWTEIGQWAQTGDLGSEQATITQTLISENTTIYAKGLISFPIMTNTFAPDLADPGQIAFALAQKSCKPYAFRIDWGADCGEESEVTISNAEPGVVTWNDHGLSDGDPIVFSTTGALPAPLVAGTLYYVVASTTNSFSVAATAGGTAIDTTTAGSGVHTALAPEQGETDLLFGFAMYGTKTGGDASATRLLNLPIQPIAPFITV